MLELKCKLTGKNFVISEQEEEACLNFNAPLPVILPEERIRRYLSFLPANNFYKRICDQSKKEILSIYPANTFFPVYDLEFWKTEKFNAFDYNLSFEFNRLFLEQLQEIWQVVPRPSLVNEGLSNSELVHNSANIKNSYWIFNCFNLENSLYSSNLVESKNCCDCYQVYLSHNCYQCLHCFECSNLVYSTQSNNCKNSWFLFNCDNCEHCIGCANLANKKYYVFNKEVSPEQFAVIKDKMGFYARPLFELAKEKFHDLVLQVDLPHCFAANSKGVTGNFLRECKNVVDSFESYSSKNLINCYGMLFSEDCLDSVSCTGVKSSVYAISCANSKKVFSSVYCYSVEDASYCLYSENCKNIFACVGLKGKEYCIFNKQFTKKQYQAMIQKIYKQLESRSLLGVSLPIGLSDFAYNYSLAGDIMPLTKVPAQLMGFKWDESEENKPNSAIAEKSRGDMAEIYSEVPEDIRQVNWQDIKDRIYLCSLSGEPFSIREKEFDFYKRNNLALPNICFKMRQAEMYSRMTSPQVFLRQCAVSGNTLKTSFGSKWKQKIVDAKRFEKN